MRPAIQWAAHLALLIILCATIAAQDSAKSGTQSKLQITLLRNATLSDHLKTGQRRSGQNRPTREAGTELFYSAESFGGKLVFVRQLRGPHLSTCPWCSKRSSMAVT